MVCNNETVIVSPEKTEIFFHQSQNNGILQNEMANQAILDLSPEVLV